jgi:tetratricopeptide (TPR) repeat protein
LVLASLLALGVGGWFGWRWYTTPVPPQIPLDGVQTEIAQAVEKALEEVRRDPRSGAAWGKLGMVLHANGFHDHILDCYLHAERFDPKNPRWPYLRGLRLLEGHRQQALQLFRQALDVADRPQERAGVLFRLAGLLIEEQQLDEADRHLQALSRIEPDSPRAHFGLASLALARGDRAAARGHLRTLTKEPFARRSACALLATLEEDRQAAREYQDLAARLPKDRPWPDPFEEEGMRHKVDRMARIAKFWDLRNQGRNEEALEFLRTFVARRPDAEVCFLLGCQLFAGNELDEAEQAFRAALRHDPSLVKAHAFLGEVLCRKADNLYKDAGTRKQALELYREAVAAADRALALEPTFGLAHLPRGRALHRLGRTDEAVRALREALVSQPQNAHVYLSLGETLAEAGRLDEGLEQLENAVRLAARDDPQPRDALEKWRARARAPRDR